LTRAASPILAVALAVAISACSGGTPSSPSAPATAPAASASQDAAAAIFTISRADGTTLPMTVDALKKLPLVTITSDGQPQEGPSLLSVLAAAGVTDFTSVTVTGTSGSKTLTKAEVTADVILDFNNRGKVKLVSPTMPKPDRVIDVATIELH
jgi:hypothetical protein